MKTQKTPEELRRLMELRRSGASGAIQSKKKYSRKNKLSVLNARIEERNGESND